MREVRLEQRRAATKASLTQEAKGKKTSILREVRLEQRRAATKASLTQEPKGKKTSLSSRTLDDWIFRHF